MNIRIITNFDGKGANLTIAGRLQSADLSALDNEIRLVDGTLLALDLSELLSVDQAGIERLRELASAGAKLRGVSGYVRMLLGE